MLCDCDTDEQCSWNWCLGNGAAGMTSEDRAGAIAGHSPAGERIGWSPVGRPAMGAAIDPPHLRRYTLGDELLEREILELFAEHAATTLVQLEAAADDAARQQGAHALKGSELAVGAWSISGLAETAEGLAASTKATAAVLGKLALAIAEARGFIVARAGPP